MSSDKILFVPNCLDSIQSEKIIGMGENKGYDVYRVPGGSMMKEILFQYDLEKVEKFVGIACPDEIGLAENYAKKLGIYDKIVSIPLIRSGCKNTECDLNDLEKKL